MIIWLDVPWNPNRMMYAIVKWSRPFFASIAKCGSMAQHSGILGRSIGWIRPGCGFEDVRRVEMGWDGLRWIFCFTQRLSSLPTWTTKANRQTYNLLILWFFHIISPWFLKCWFCLNQCPFVPLAISATLRWADHEIGKKHRKAVRRDLASSRELSVSNSSWGFSETGAIGCEWVSFLYISVMFQGLDEDTWKSEKGDDYKAGCFFGDQKSMYEEFSPKWTSKRR